MEHQELLQEVTGKARSWLDSSIDHETRERILDMMENDPDELIESFYQSLEFGSGNGDPGPVQLYEVVLFRA